MKNITIIFGIIICSIFYHADIFAGKTVKVKLTGTVYEPIKIKIGNTGRVESITSLPFVFEVSKDQLPMNLQFISDTYIYHDINVPQKPIDTTGHIYLVKVNETAMSLRNNNGTVSRQQFQETVVASTNNSKPLYSFDPSKGVNAAPETGVINDKTFALIISNEDYEMAVNVENAMNDGLAFKEYCEKTLGIPTDNVRHLQNLSYGKMKKAFSDILELTELMRGEGNLIIYYAGHGIPDNKTKDAFLMPVDADGTDTDLCLSLSKLYDMIDSKNMNRCVVFIDACFSGAQRGGDMIVAARSVKLKPKEVKPAGKTIVFSATSEDEAAFSHKEEKHGLFTYYLLSKLQSTKGKVSLGELADYLTEKVALESRRKNNSPQTPKVVVSDGMSNNWRSIKLTK